MKDEERGGGGEEWTAEKRQGEAKTRVERKGMRGRKEKKRGKDRRGEQRRETARHTWTSDLGHMLMSDQQGEQPCAPERL